MYFYFYFCLMIKKEDELWKGMIESSFTDFIRFVHPGIDNILDLDRGYEFLDKELEQVFPPYNELYGNKEVDKLVKVYTKEGNEQWVLFHVEVQAKYSEEFGRRMFEYYYRLFDKYKKPITAYAIFTEATARIRSNVFTRSFLGTTLTYQFNTYKIAAQTEKELLKSDNPFAIVVMAARVAFAGKHIKDKKERDLLTLRLKINLVKELLSRNFAKHKVRAIMKFIIFYIRFEFIETKIIFDNKLHTLTKYTQTMGIEEQIEEMLKKEATLQGRKEGLREGKREGKKEGKTEVQKRLAQKLIFILGYSDKQAAEFIEVPVKFITDFRRQEKWDGAPKSFRKTSSDISL